MDWYSVRCVFGDRDSARLLEERITLWRASSFDDAVERAEREAKEYARALNLRYLELAQAFKLPEEPSDGAEMFSLMRESDLPDDAYLTTFSTPEPSDSSTRSRRTSSGQEVLL